MGIGIVIEPNPCGKVSYEEILISSCMRDGDLSLGSQVVFFRYPILSSSLALLLQFVREVSITVDSEESKSSELFGSRDGGGLIDIVCGGALDPRCNQNHGNAIQYLDDQHVLDVLASRESPDIKSFVTSVFLLSESTSTKLNAAVCGFGTIDRIAFITVSDAGSIAVGNDTYPLLRKGEIVAISSGVDLSLFKVSTGSFVGVCFGTPGVVRSRAATGSVKSGPKPVIDTRVVLRSKYYSDIPTTVNRLIGTDGLYQSQIACPDCRRPLDIVGDDVVRMESPESADPGLNLVVVIWNTAMADSLQDVDISGYTSDKWLLHTDEKLLAGRDVSKWTHVCQVRGMSRYKIKRGNLDSCVPAGYVSPTLFSRESDPLMYTMIQALSIPDLEGKLIRIVDMGNGEHITLRASVNLYKQIVYELRDWNHPCHRPRRSALGLFREWARSYSLSDLA